MALQTRTDRRRGLLPGGQGRQLDSFIYACFDWVLFFELLLLASALRQSLCDHVHLGIGVLNYSGCSSGLFQFLDRFVSGIFGPGVESSPGGSGSVSNLRSAL